MVQLCQCHPLSLCPVGLKQTRFHRSRDGAVPFDVERGCLWQGMLCLAGKVESSAQEIKFLTTVETSVRQGTASCFFQFHSGCSGFTLLLNPLITLEWEPGGEGSDGWEQHLWGKILCFITLRIKPEGDEAQKPLFRNALRPGHSCSTILVKGVLREMLFLIWYSNSWDLTGIKRDAAIKGAM